MRHAVFIEKIQRFRIYVDAGNKREAAKKAKGLASVTWPDVPAQIDVIEIVPEKEKS